MPTYDYHCDHCGRFEFFQPITEPPLAQCPTCGGPVRKLLSRNVNILFRGSGFHVTDYRSESYKSAARREESTVSSGSSSSSGPSKGD